MRTDFRGRLFFLLLAALLAPASAQAQRVSGRVTDETARAPVPEVEVSAVAGERVIARALTDRDGRYALVLPEEGRIVIRAARLGYATWLSDTFEANRSTDVKRDIALRPAPIAADSILVTTRGGIERGAVSFQRRCLAGVGVCLGPASLAQRDARRVTDLFQAVEGIAVRQTAPNSEPVIASLHGYGCLVVFLDNQVQPAVTYDRNRTLQGTITSGTGALGNARTMRGSGLNVLDPAAIRGIEIYRGFHEVPQELLRTQRAQMIWPATGRATQPCGVAIVWTTAGW